MIRVRFVEADGNTHIAELPEGESAMRGALDLGLPGIDGDCGGECICATCFCFVDDAWVAATGVASDDERELLALAEVDDPRARLSCQIRAAPQLDGLVLHLPA